MVGVVFEVNGKIGNYYMNKLFHHMFKEVHNAKSRKDKIAVLHHYSSPALKQVLGYTYDPNIVFDLPEGNPPYKALDEDDEGCIDLQGELRRMYLFIKGGNEGLKPLRREMLFIELLQSLDPRDAKVVLMMKNKKLDYNGLTKKLVQEAFPNLGANW